MILDKIADTYDQLMSPGGLWHLLMMMGGQQRQLNAMTNENQLI